MNGLNDLGSNVYYKKEGFILLKGNTFEVLDKFSSNTFDMIFADPPYFLSSGGISCKSGKQVKVDKGKWDIEKDIYQKLEFHRTWISKCKRILKENGTIWISSTLHSVYAIGVALEMEGFSIINNVIWQKTNPAPNLSCRAFTHSTETILWARKINDTGKKGNHTFHYKEMKESNGNKQMKDVWNFEEDEIWKLSTVTKMEKRCGFHPTQKPIKLLERIILASTNENDLILDPFCGSGTTGISAIRNKRNFVGIESEEEYLELSKKRYEAENEKKF